MFCPKCGQQLSDDSIFCTNCGTSLNNQANNQPIQNNNMANTQYQNNNVANANYNHASYTNQHSPNQGYANQNYANQNYAQPNYANNPNIPTNNIANSSGDNSKLIKIVGSICAALIALSIIIVIVAVAKNHNSSYDAYADGDITADAPITQDDDIVSFSEYKNGADTSSTSTDTSSSPSSTSYITNVATNAAISSVTASSYLTEVYRTEVYIDQPENVLDGNFSTAWIEDGNGFGVGEWLQVNLNSTYAVNGIRIYNGLMRSEKYFSENAKIKKLRVRFSDGTSEDFSLHAEYSKANELTFKQPHQTSYLKLEILAAYTGSGCDDTCISELSLF